VQEIKTLYNESIEKNDLCARSGLVYGVNSAIVYVSDLRVAVAFYRDLFGPAAVRFEAEDCASYIIEDGMELFVQSAPEDSPFRDLVGTQTLGLTVSSARFHELAAALPEDASLDPASWTGGIALDEGFLFSDPEGNRLLLVPAMAPATA
jgi:catechol 2,3-dioxygenase-like lactoylglutathione lyase family enzyme